MADKRSYIHVMLLLQLKTLIGVYIYYLTLWKGFLLAVIALLRNFAYFKISIGPLFACVRSCNVRKEQRSVYVIYIVFVRMHISYRPTCTSASVCNIMCLYANVCTYVQSPCVNDVHVWTCVLHLMGL